MNEGELVVCAVLSGNRNFEARIHPEVKANYLASPPLVVAYALAGRIDLDLTSEPLGRDSGRARRLPARPLADAGPDQGHDRGSDQRGHVPAHLCRRLHGRRELGRPAGARGRSLRLGSRLDLRPPAALLRGHVAGARDGRGRAGARCLVMVGDSVTTDHISPAGAIKPDSPAGHVPDRARRRAQGLQLLRLAAREPRGDGARHVRQRPPAQPARPRRARAPGRCTCPTARRRPSSRRPSATAPRACPRSSSRARSTARAPPATGRRRARTCSASAPSSPRPTSASTART